MATRTISVAGGNFDSTGTWDEGFVPVAGDAVVARAGGTSGNLTVNVPSACASFIMTNYTGTLTFNSTLTLTSTCTFVSGMTIAGTAGTLILTGASTITSGGKTLTCAFSMLTNAITITLGDNWTVNGLVSISPTSGTATFNGNQMTCAGGFTGPTSTGNVAGTTKFVLTGGTWSQAGGGSLATDVDLAGNVTVSGIVICGATSKTLTYVSGTITVTGSTLRLPNGSTIATAGMTWNNITLGSGVSVTLNSRLNWSGTLSPVTAANTAMTFGGTGALNGTGAVDLSVSTSGYTLTLNNTGGLVTTGTLTIGNAATTFAGSAGFTVGTLTTATLTASRTHTLTFGNTYTVTTALSNVGTSATVRQSLVSSSPGNKVVFTVRKTASVQLTNCDPTDIDSNDGGKVLSVSGTITTTNNWINSIAAGVNGSSTFHCPFIKGVT